MIKVYGFTQDKVSKSVSKSRPYITNALRSFKISQKGVRKEVAEGRLSAGHARAILSADKFPETGKNFARELSQKDFRLEKQKSSQAPKNRRETRL